MKCNYDNKYNDEKFDLRDYGTLLKEIYVASEEKMKECGAYMENALKVSYIKGWVYVCKMQIPAINLYVVAPLQEIDLALCGKTFEQFESDEKSQTKVWLFSFCIYGIYNFVFAKVFVSKSVSAGRWVLKPQ